jgi:tRNA acetyltransferase TAN1
MKDIQDDGGVKTRYLYKMTPIETSCHASLENMEINLKKVTDSFFERYPQGVMKSWKSIIKMVHHNEIKQKQCIDIIVKSLKSYHFVDLTKPHVVIFIVIFKNTCGIGIMDEYMTHMELNINKLRTVDGDESKTENVKIETEKIEEKLDPMEKIEEKPEAIGSEKKTKKIGGINLF